MHRLLVGRSGCGKSVMAKGFVDVAINEGKRVVIFNPMREIFNNRAEAYSSPANFYLACKDRAGGRVLMVVDEIPVLLEHSKDKFNHFISHARHYGAVVMLVQRPRVLLTPTLLAQCRDIIVFTQGLKADKIFIANETGIPLDDLNALNINKFEYIHKTL